MRIRTRALASGLAGFLCVAMFAVFSVGCGGIPKGALLMHPQTLEQRQLQTRRFLTSDEKKILTAVAGLLQDLGFGIDASETRLGMIVASKDRDATDGGQIVGAALVSALFGTDMVYDKNQKMRVSVVTHPSANEIAIRVTFQRIVWDNYGRVSRLEALDDAEMYQQFFEKLSKAVFLEAHEI